MKTSLKHDQAFRETLEAIGARVKELRVKKGYRSHADFASDYNLPSIQYWRIERGRANMTMMSLHKILAVHGLTMQDFFCHGVVAKQLATRRKG